MADWRVENAKGFEGARFKRKRYTRWSEDWDHDHCIACWATFAEFDGPDIQHEGYASCADGKHRADYDWVCLACFADLREAFGWVEVDDQSG
jgi:hypothetical protein